MKQSKQKYGEKKRRNHYVVHSLTAETTENMSDPNIICQVQARAHCLGFALYSMVIGVTLIIDYSLSFIFNQAPLPEAFYLFCTLLGLVYFLVGLAYFPVSSLSPSPPAAGGAEALSVKLIPNQIFKTGQSQVLLRLLLKTNPDTQSSSSPPPTPGFQ